MPVMSKPKWLSMVMIEMHQHRVGFRPIQGLDDGCAVEQVRIDVSISDDLVNMGTSLRPKDEQRPRK